MKNFVIRVELLGHGHDSPAYQRLHEAMAAKSVLRSIVGDDGMQYALPTGSYSYVGNYETRAVADWISTIVNSLGYQHKLIVTNGDSAWRLTPS